MAGLAGSETTRWVFFILCPDVIPRYAFRLNSCVSGGPSF